jgi:hypothetical protein
VGLKKYLNSSVEASSPTLKSNECYLFHIANYICEI